MERGGKPIGGNEERIFVSVRLRPSDEKAILSNEVSDWECINDNTIVYKNVRLLASERSTYPTAYTFDRVFGGDCSTREVYDQGAKEVALSVVHGINSTVIVYGQTSSGKTHTMTGITEYAIADMYEYIQNHPERDFILKFSAMEIYGESVKDLLGADNSPLRLLDDPERGTVVEKLTEETLRHWDHATQLLSVCVAQRRIGETTLNETNSRSHKIIRLTIESSSRGFLGRSNASTLAATVNFVKLGGSDRGFETLSAGTKLKEGYHMDRSLQTLETVIHKLSNEASGHIHYGDSMLTRILQTSLGGNARTAIICTMNPARTNVQQSRNTLNFASCAKEVATNAKVNVVISDKALVKHLQKETERLESELRSNQSNSVQSIYSAMLREKDAKIEKLEREIKDLLLQRDIAQSQVKELLRTLGDDASPFTAAGSGNYPQLRVRKSPDMEILEMETYVLAGTQSFDIDSSTGYSRSISGDHFAKILYFDETVNASQRMSMVSSTSSVSDSYHSLDGVEKENNGTMEGLCKEVHCIETEEMSNRESNYLFSEDYPAVKVRVNGDGQDMELASPSSSKDEIFTLSPLKDKLDMKKHTASSITHQNNRQEFISAAVMEDREPIFGMMENKKAFSSLKSLVITSRENPRMYPGITSLENSSLASHLAKDTFGTWYSNLSRSKSSKASFITNSTSPWLTGKQYSDYTPSVGSEKESDGFARKIYTLKCSSNVDTVLRENCPHPLENALDIEIDKPVVKVPTSKDGFSKSSCPDLSKKPDPSTEQQITGKPDNEIASNINEPPKEIVNSVDLGSVEDESRVITSWPVEFRKLQRETIELWDACNVSLVHRTYFFLLFQGDPSDAIYLEVEIRRLKFLKDKYSRGEKTTVNGQQLSLSSSKKALRHEREMLSKQMLKKFLEQERESLFQDWGIGLNTKMRRLQLAELVWTKTDDMNHIVDSALLVAKLVGIIEPGQSLNKEMFGLHFTPTRASGISTFKRSLVSIL